MARKKADDINLNGYQDSDYDNLTVSDTDYSECSVSGADNVLSESASDNKKVFDTFPKMIAAKFNGLIKKLKNGNLVQDENYVHTDNNFTDEHKETVDNLPGDVSNIKEQLKTGNFVQDANYVHTDNNFTDYYKDAVDVSHDHALAAMSIAQGANQAVSFNNYQEMVNFFNFNPNWGFVDNFEKRYNIGQNIMIGTVNVPDLWIAETAYDVGFEEYNYVSDEDFIKDINSALENGEFLRVGYVRLGILETQKVDLTDYVKDKNYVHTDKNYTAEEKTKLEGIAGGAQVNVIETVKVNGKALGVNQKSVNVTVPTKLTELDNDGNFVVDDNYVHTDNNYTTEEIQKLSVYLDEKVFVFIKSTFQTHLMTLVNAKECQCSLLDCEVTVDISKGCIFPSNEFEDNEFLRIKEVYDESIETSYSGELLTRLMNNEAVRMGYFDVELIKSEFDYNTYSKIINTQNYLLSKSIRHYKVPDDTYILAESNVVYNISADKFNEVDFEFPQETALKAVNEYHISLDTSADSDGNIIPSVLFRDVIKWATPFEIKVDTHYEIAIRNGYGVIAEFNEVIT